MNAYTSSWGIKSDDIHYKNPFASRIRMRKRHLQEHAPAYRDPILVHANIRLDTFNDWNHQPDGKDLAEAGFFMTSHSSAECVFCGKSIGIDWYWSVVTHTTLPALCDLQIQHYDRCPFDNGYDVGNIPINDDMQVEDIMNQMTKRPSTDKFHLKDRAAARRNPKLKNAKFRLATFKKVGYNYQPDPEELAEAGFHLTFLQDDDSGKWEGRCVYCSLWINNKVESPIMDAHKSNSPECPFIQGLDVGNRNLKGEKMMKKSKKRKIDEAEI